MYIFGHDFLSILSSILVATNITGSLDTIDACYVQSIKCAITCLLDKRLLGEVNMSLWEDEAARIPGDWQVIATTKAFEQGIDE